MLRPKTAKYPWKCFCCEGVFDSLDEPAVIWVTPEGEVCFACANCEEQTHVEDITCLSCFKTFITVYHDGHNTVVCDCGHVNDLWELSDDDCGEFEEWA